MEIETLLNDPTFLPDLRRAIQVCDKVAEINAEPLSFGKTNRDRQFPFPNVEIRDAIVLMQGAWLLVQAHATGGKSKLDPALLRQNADLAESQRKTLSLFLGTYCDLAWIKANSEAALYSAFRSVSDHLLRRFQDKDVAVLALVHVLRS
jgi:hypothetical protein